MKKFALVIMMMTLTSIQLKAGSETVKPNTAVTAQAAEANALIARLNEINAMDKSEISFSEKRDLRKEVRAAKKHLREVHGGVYLSLGVIILIIVLLIILL